jgi:CRP-like cAMP-binding protein
MSDLVEQSIAGNPFFSGLDRELIDILLEHAVIRQLATGQVLFKFGEPAKHFYLVRSGNIALEVVAMEGPTLELQNVGPGSIVGWSWLIAPFKWNFHARAKAPTELVEFDGDAIRARCEADPKLGYALLKRFSTLMSERLQFARERMMEEWRPPGFA